MGWTLTSMKFRSLNEPLEEILRVDRSTHSLHLFIASSEGCGSGFMVSFVTVPTHSPLNFLWSHSSVTQFRDNVATHNFALVIQLLYASTSLHFRHLSSHLINVPLSQSDNRFLLWEVFKHFLGRKSNSLIIYGHYG